MRKPNYRFERAERDRLKRAKKEEKARRHQERTLADKSAEGDHSDASAASGNGQGLEGRTPDPA